MKEQKSVHTVQILDKALELLEVLAGSPGHVSLQALTEKVGLTRNKAYRILTTLCQKGLVEKDPGTGGYCLGLSSAALGQKLSRSISLTSYAYPIMEELAKRHDEAVYVTVIRDGDVLFLDMVDCERNIKTTPFVGKQVPFFTTAAGKVMRSLDSRELLEKILRKRELKNVAPDIDTLESELFAIRAKGVAVDSGGLGEGIISVAVAVRDYAGKIVGAITVLGPSFRMLAERLDKEIIPSLVEGAGILSQKFGYAPA